MWVSIMKHAPLKTLEGLWRKDRQVGEERCWGKKTKKRKTKKREMKSHGVAFVVFVVVVVVVMLGLLTSGSHSTTYAYEVPRQTPAQAAAFEQINLEAKAASEAATPALLEYLETPTFRQSIANLPDEITVSFTFVLFCFILFVLLVC